MRIQAVLSRLNIALGRCLGEPSEPPLAVDLLCAERLMEELSPQSHRPHVVQIFTYGTSASGVKP
jgi:hypothetical protein